MKARPGRKLAAEKNRVAAMTLYEFYLTDDFDGLPSRVRLSIIQLCKNRWTDRLGRAALKKARENEEA